ncbi:GTP-binding protein 10 isoform X1 [Tachyglossus aculeatus]|uniref:GTP-binding protein 10 isoform X1 n=1 Tax=Tachyglossus aculeatus TaxID=9261 RepID=UPI0018F5408C|nr:GTP-binding protein 10 isoform X1 [Tachyglossus aculeatus]
MVRSGLRLQKHGNFIDNLRLFTQGGTGGMGYPRLGGEGGKGGDVWVVAQKGMTLKKIKDLYPQKRFVAERGANSQVRALKGQKGKDRAIPAPVGISVTDENGRVIGELNKDKDKVLVAQGGLGGCLFSNFLPLKGQKRIIILDLKLIADIGLVGFPNAGKSSLLSKVSHAHPDIADYAFTTIKPELGKIMFPDYKQISVADLPGLIEGAHMNLGMGHRFLKHVERTKQLLFVVDVSGFQLSSYSPFRTAFETIALLTKELELYQEELQTKPSLLVINKMDLPDAEEKCEELLNQLKAPKDPALNKSSEMTQRGAQRKKAMPQESGWQCELGQLASWPLFLVAVSQSSFLCIPSSSIGLRNSSEQEYSI